PRAARATRGRSGSAGPRPGCAPRPPSLRLVVVVAGLAGLARLAHLLLERAEVARRLRKHRDLVLHALELLPEVVHVLPDRGLRLRVAAVLGALAEEAAREGGEVRDDLRGALGLRHGGEDAEVVADERHRGLAQVDLGLGLQLLCGHGQGGGGGRQGERGDRGFGHFAISPVDGCGCGTKPCALWAKIRNRLSRPETPMGGVRIEKDTFGPIEVPSDRLWGAQTQRSLENFRISGERVPAELLQALAWVKRACAAVNEALGALTAEKARAIQSAADEVLAGRWPDEFPLVVWQTGSGTQTNMNMNEVLANRASELLGGARGESRRVHPNDDVNRGQ